MRPFLRVVLVLVARLTEESKQVERLPNGLILFASVPLLQRREQNAMQGASLGDSLGSLNGSNSDGDERTPAPPRKGISPRTGRAPVHSAPDNHRIARVMDEAASTPEAAVRFLQAVGYEEFAAQCAIGGCLDLAEELARG